MKYGEFKQQFQAIKDGRASFAPVYIVSGDDEYLKDEVLALFKSAVDPEYADFNHAYINPHILEYDDSETKTMDEGCLSLPGIHEPVKRPTRILVRWMEPDFTEREEWVDGYLARVLQHEIDHLEGKVFTDRLTPLRKQMIRSKMTALVKGKFRCGYKTK